MYQAELADAPKEVRRGFAGNVLHYFPKVAGIGNVLADDGPAPTYSIFKPDGSIILNAAAVAVAELTASRVRSEDSHAIATANHAANVLTLTFDEDPELAVGQPCTTTLLTAAFQLHGVPVATVSADGLTVTFPLVHADGGDVFHADALCIEESAVDRFDLLVDAHDIGTYALGEHYRIDILWSFGGVERLESIRFDVCREPYAPMISLNDFVEEVFDAEQFLEGQANAIDDGRTAEQHASVLGVKAWGDVYGWLQARLRDEGKIMPRLCLDRSKIHKVVRAQAIFRMFKGETSQGRKEAMEEWKLEARAQFTAIGDLDYDRDDDGVQDAKVHSPVDWSCRRSWH